MSKASSPEEIVNEIQKLCKQLGWHISFDDSSSTVKGLVVGQYDYIISLINDLQDYDNFIIYSLDKPDEREIH